MYRLSLPRYLMLLCLSSIGLLASSLAQAQSTAPNAPSLTVELIEQRIARYTEERMGTLDPSILKGAQGEGEHDDHVLSKAEEESMLRESERHYWRVRFFAEHPDARSPYRERGGGALCTNGGFEDGTEGWSAEAGQWNNGQCTGTANSLAFAPYPFAGNETHFALVSSGQDLISGVDRVHGGAQSMRINWVRRPENCTPSRWLDKVTQEIVLTAPSQQVGFYFASVFEQPADHPNRQPYFMARAIGPDGLVQDEYCEAPDLDSPFLETAITPYPTVETCTGFEAIRYTNWNCNILNVSGQVGDTITLEFITADCAQGGHFGYSYLDDVCTECLDPITGLVQLDPGQYCISAPFQVCGTYIPANDGGVPATVTGWDLQILNNGQAWPGPQFTLAAHDPVAHTFCFDVDPSNLDAGVGYDIAVQVFFSTNNDESDVNSTPGPNNDILFTPEVCCPVMAPQLLTCLPVSGTPNGNAILDWSDVPGAMGYQVEFTTYSAACCAGTAGTPQVSTVATLDANSMYIMNNSNLLPCATWRVRAQCAGGVWGAWSEAQCLCSNNTCATSPPSSLACSHASTPGVGGAATLSWVSNGNANQFEVRVTTFSQVCCPGNSGLSTSMTFTTTTPSYVLANAGNYPCATWQVRERCYGSYWSPWSAATCLCGTAYCATTAPIGLNCANQNNNLTLSWATIPYAMQYEVVIRTHACAGCTASGTSLQYTYLTNTTSLSTLDQLMPANMYPCGQWRVRARCSNGTWSLPSTALCICSNSSNCTSLVSNGTFQVSTSAGPITSCATGVVQTWRPYQNNFSMTDSRIYAPLRNGVGTYTAFPNTTNPESHDALTQNQRYMGFLCVNSTAGTNIAGRAGVTQTVVPTVVVGGNYYLRFRYAFYRQSGTGTSTFQVRALVGNNPGCVPTATGQVFAENVTVANTLANLVWVTRTVPFTATAVANALSVEARAVSMSANTRIMFYLDGVELVRYPCRQDLNGDGVVGVADLNLLIGYYGANVNSIINLCHAGADANANGAVDDGDITVLSNQFGVCGSSGLAQEGVKSLEQGIITSEEGLVAVPNPNNGRFALHLPDVAHNAPLRVYATDGRMVFNTTTQGDARMDLDLSALPNGLYSVVITTTDGEYGIRIVKE